MELWTEKLDLEIWLLLSSPECCKDKVEEMDKAALAAGRVNAFVAWVLSSELL